MSDDQRVDRRMVALLALLTTVLFADALFFGRNFYRRDLYRYHFPMKKVVRDTILSGDFPLWSRWFAAGQPMAANPAYEIFYPPQWLIFVGPYTFGFALHIIAHVYLAAIGMYLLIRRLSCRPAVAFFAAVSFAYGGFLLGSMTTLPTFFVWAWAPLAGWAVAGVMQDPSSRRVAIASLILGMQLLVGEPVALLQVWLLILVATRSRKMFPVFAWSGAIALVQLLPAIDHTRDSIRSRGLPFDVVVDFSMPPLRIFELIVPQVINYIHFARAPYLLSISAGIAAGILAIIGVIRRVRGWALFLAIATVSYVLAIGDATPLYRLLYAAGVGKALRYPEKFIASLVFALVVFAALVAQHLVEDRRPRLSWLIVLLLLVDNVRAGREVSSTLPHELFTPPPAALPLKGAIVFHRGGWNAADPAYEKVRDMPVWWSSRNALLPYTPAAWGIYSVMELDYDETALLPTHDLLDLLRRRGNSSRPNWADPLMMMSGVTHVIDFADPTRGQPVRVTPFRSFGKYYLPGGRVLSVKESANSAVIDAEGPGLLIAAVTRHKYWRATVDDKPTDLLPVNVAYQAMQIPAGRHRAVMRYRNPIVIYSGIVSLAAFAAAIIMILRRPRPRPQTGS